MPTSHSNLSNLNSHKQSGFSLVEVLVAILLVALVLLAWPTGDNDAHRELVSTIESIDKSLSFAANEAVLRNTVVRLRLSLEKSPVEYTVEYGPAGNLPLPELSKDVVKSLAQEKTEKEKLSFLDKQFTKVEEFEDVKVELSDEVTVLGVGSSSQRKLMTGGEANIYFYPTGEKDAALIFFATTQEIAWMEVQPFLSYTNKTYQLIDSKRVAKLEDILQTKMDEVYKEWIGR
ncbi:MAG: prepilin-type N-terminal cleavage/methylation domain-containing protein [Bacteriovoracaceae bacterium]